MVDSGEPQKADTANNGHVLTAGHKVLLTILAEYAVKEFQKADRAADLEAGADNA